LRVTGHPIFRLCSPYSIKVRFESASLRPTCPAGEDRQVSRPCNGEDPGLDEVRPISWNDIIDLERDQCLEFSIPSQVLLKGENHGFRLVDFKIAFTARQYLVSQSDPTTTNTIARKKIR